jgi:hypothetical protein
LHSLCSSKKSYLKFRGQELFTPLESPNIYAGDGGNRKHQLLIEGGVKALPFLTGFAFPSNDKIEPNVRGIIKNCHIVSLHGTFLKKFPF